MFSSNANLLLLEIAVYLAVILCAGRLPSVRLVGLTQVRRSFQFIAERRAIAVISVVAFVLVARGALLPILPPPVPGVHDEFSYLLAADTFALGRLTNPAHPLWQFFESFHIIQRPTYASMYPPAQGLMMALGQAAAGTAWAGVYVSAALMCGSICWMLQAMVPPQWALMGGLLAALRWGIYSYWMESYWGGAVAAMAGALAVGALYRIFAKRTAWPSVILACALVLLANSRPYEGLLFTLPLLASLGLWMFGKRSPSARIQLQRVLLPMAMVFVLGGGLMGYYFWRVTGNPLRMPYQVNEEAYAVTNPFLWQPLRPVPQYRNAVMRNYYPVREMAAYRQSHSVRGWLVETWRKATTMLFFYFWPAVLPVVFSLPIMWKNRRARFALICGAVMLFGLTLEIWPMTLHYHAPITGLMVLLVIQAMRYLRHVRWRDRPVGIAVSRAVPLFCAAILVIRVGAAILHVPVPEHGLTPWFSISPGNTERARILNYLEKQPGQQLVMVHYEPDHNVAEEWVYNRADIDDAKVVWARDFGSMKNSPLLAYFKQRNVWMLEPDRNPPRLSRR